MAASLARDLGGETVWFMADRALFWPSRNRLFICDLHLGKADAFRRSGIALPHGGTDDDLSRLSALIDATGAGEVMVLGDFLHGSAGQTLWRRQWLAWRDPHASLAVRVLAGNHDRALATAGLGIEHVGDALDDGPFALRHAPTRAPDRHVLCGHVHPVWPLPGLPGRWPSFWLREGCTVLPAFSRFTGGIVPALGANEEAIACAQGELVRLRQAGRRRGFQGR